MSLEINGLPFPYILDKRYIRGEREKELGKLNGSLHRFGLSLVKEYEEQPTQLFYIDKILLRFCCAVYEACLLS